MRRVNGSGSVYKLKDRPRRKPWVASVSGLDSEGFRIRRLIGTYETKKEAMAALEAYNVDPYNLKTSKYTFAQIFELFAEEASNHLSQNSIKSYRAAINSAPELHDRVFLDLRHSDLQRVLDTSKKNLPMLEALKKAISGMYKYAMKNDIVKKNYAEFLTIPKRAANPDARPHVPYEQAEINLLWQHSGELMADFQLILIYCGARISELIELSPADVDLEAQTFTIRQAKTRAGVRTVPIADQVLPLWKNLADPSRSALLIGETGAAIQYQEIRRLWDRYNKTLGITHMPHDCRHTAITRMTAAGVDSRIIKKIVGHKAMDVTEDVYTHADRDMMLRAVNLI